MKTLRVGKFPGMINEVIIENGSTVAEVLELAGLSPEGYEAQLDGVVVTPDTNIGNDSNLLVLAKQVKGAMKTIRVGKFPGMINEVVVEDNATVGSILELAGLDHAGYEIQLDGNVVQATNTVGADSNLLILAKQVKGA